MTAGDIIFACASGIGRSGVAVIRISGSGSSSVFQALTGSPPPKPRQASLRMLYTKDKELLDKALTIYFPAPRSFTGEETVELHIHGGPAVINGVLSALAGLQGFRPAEAGEFTRRAYRNGKMDLAEAEGLGDLITADTAAGRRQAIWQMQGGLTAKHAEWRECLISASALAEAELDFSDEPVPEDLEGRWKAEIFELKETLTQYLREPPITERLNDGFRVVLVGAPNAGKSSLLNALARREAAIVTDIPGTTRDILEVRLDLDGYPVTVVDTAGLRETADPIEQEGVRRAYDAQSLADLILEVQDITSPSKIPNLPENRLIFHNKLDLLSKHPSNGIAGSAKTGEGLKFLELELTKAAKTAIEGAPQPLATRYRHRAALEEAVAAMSRASEAPAPELAAEDLRLASRALGRIAGVVDVEDVLDRIFSSFCIGK